MKKLLADITFYYTLVTIVGGFVIKCLVSGFKVEFNEFKDKFNSVKKDKK